MRGVRHVGPAVLALTALLPAAPVEASQPYSESLLDCAALHTIVNRRNPGRAETEKGQALLAYAEALVTEAMRQAKGEGHEDPAGYVKAMLVQKIGHWDGKSDVYFLTGDFLEWVRYCHKFGEHLGVERP